MVSSTVSPETATTPAREIGNGIQAAKSTSGAGGGRGGARSEEDPAVRATLAAQTRFDGTSASAGDRLIGRWNSWRRSRIRACVEEGWPTAARGRIARGRGYNLIRHILLSSCVSKRMTAAKIAATARTRSSPTLRGIGCQGVHPGRQQRRRTRSARTGAGQEIGGRTTRPAGIQPGAGLGTLHRKLRWRYKPSWKHPTS